MTDRETLRNLRSEYRPRGQGQFLTELVYQMFQTWQRIQKPEVPRGDLPPSSRTSGLIRFDGPPP